jgi:glyoxylase-like metal-dependent hydrolase (beta-lactamase superfamily II)
MNTAAANPPAPLGVVILPVTPFQQNCSLVWCTRTNRAALVDPGGEVEALLAEVAKRGLTLEKVLLTHGHLDHCAGTATVRALTGVPVEGPQREDDFWIRQLPENARSYGFPPAESFTPDRWLEDGDQVTVGELTFDVVHCPGHTPGHVVFLHAPTRVAFVGDVLFAGSIGRTDFPRGNHADLVASIRDKLFPRGDDIRFVPGHGPTSSFGAERRTNPFVGDRAVGNQ